MEEIERRQPWQNFIETTFNIQRRMANYHFARAGNWEHLVAEHDRWPAAIRKGTERTKEGTATGARRRSSVR